VRDKTMIKKIDIQKERYLLFVDTETIGTLNVKESVLPFEIGTKVYDLATQKVVREKSYLVRKFFNNKYIMLSTFSATKYPKYFEKLENDKRYKTCSVNDIMQDLTKVISRYNIKIMVAHNGNFDKTAISRLCEDFEIENPFEKLDLLDTMELSKVITFSKDYANYCIENKDILNSLKDSCFITNSGRVRTTAQAIYSYLTKNPNFQEEHTGLEDIDIEIEIFKSSLDTLGNTLVDLNVAPTWRDYSIVVDTN
jgi:DNA polymerase III alpha subunit (gram-positive type)